MNKTQKIHYLNRNANIKKRMPQRFIFGIGLTLVSFLTFFGIGYYTNKNSRVESNIVKDEPRTEQKIEQRVFSGKFYDNLGRKLEIHLTQDDKQKPASEYRISNPGIEMIKQSEGLREEAYRCPGGVWTIGYGHTKNVNEGDKITREKAIEYLIEDLKYTENAVRKNVAVPLTQRQYDALVSFVFNIGTGAFESSTLLKKLNSGDYKGASDEFLRWNKVTINGKKSVCDGLTKRREKERNHFLGCN